MKTNTLVGKAERFFSDDLGEACQAIGFKTDEANHCWITVEGDDLKTELIPLKSALQYFKPGRGFF